MKTINKRTLDALIELRRELSETPYCEANVDRIIKEMIAAAERIETPDGYDWSAVYLLVEAVLCGLGLKRDATNEDIYTVFAVLGWEVRDEA